MEQTETNSNMGNLSPIAVNYYLKCNDLKVQIKRLRLSKYIKYT